MNLLKHKLFQTPGWVRTNTCPSFTARSRAMSWDICSGSGAGSTANSPRYNILSSEFYLYLNKFFRSTVLPGPPDLTRPVVLVTRPSRDSSSTGLPWGVEAGSALSPRVVLMVSPRALVRLSSRSLRGTSSPSPRREWAVDSRVSESWTLTGLARTLPTSTSRWSWSMWLTPPSDAIPRSTGSWTPCRSTASSVAWPPLARAPAASARARAPPRPRAAPGAPDGSGRTPSVSAGSVKECHPASEVDFVYMFHIFICSFCKLHCCHLAENKNFQTNIAFLLIASLSSAVQFMLAVNVCICVWTQGSVECQRCSNEWLTCSVGWCDFSIETGKPVFDRSKKRPFTASIYCRTSCEKHTFDSQYTF